jgi:hypothetical protein
MITLKPWYLRGYGDCWMVYVELPKSSSIAALREIKEKLNSLTESGLYLVENNSPAIKR